MPGDDIERELTRALAIEPSDGFEGRVLRAVDEDRRRGARVVSLGWLSVAAALLLTTATAMLWPHRPDTTALPGEQTTALGHADPPRVPEPLTRIAENEAPSSATHGVAASGLSSPQAARPRRPLREPNIVVIVDHRQRDAIARYMRDINRTASQQGRAAVIAVDAEPGGVPLVTITPLAIEPLEIDPGVPAPSGGSH